MLLRIRPVFYIDLKLYFWKGYLVLLQFTETEYTLA